MMAMLQCAKRQVPCEVYIPWKYLLPEVKEAFEKKGYSVTPAFTEVGDNYVLVAPNWK